MMKTKSLKVDLVSTRVVSTNSMNRIPLCMLFDEKKTVFSYVNKQNFLLNFYWIYDLFVVSVLDRDFPHYWAATPTCLSVYQMQRGNICIPLARGEIIYFATGSLARGAIFESATEPPRFWSAILILKRQMSSLFRLVFFIFFGGVMF